MARLKDISKEEFSIKGINQFYSIDLEKFFEGKKMKLVTSSVQTSQAIIRLMIEIEKDLSDESQKNVGKVFYVRIPLNKGIKEDHVMTVELLKGGHTFDYNFLGNVISESIVNNVLYITAESTKLKKTDGSSISVTRTGIYDEDNLSDTKESQEVLKARKVVISRTGKSNREIQKN